MMKQEYADVTGAIFDLDGTLLNSMYIWTEIGTRFMEKHGIVPTPQNQQDFLKMSLEQAADYYRANFDANATKEDIINEINTMVEGFYFHDVQLKPGVKELLDVLKSKNVKCCVATATDKYMVEAALKRNGILPYFSEIFTCTTVGAGKDTAVIYDEALRHLGTEKDKTLVFEDAYYAMKTAHAAGYRVIAVRDIAEEADETAIRAVCERYISGYEEIAPLF